MRSLRQTLTVQGFTEVDNGVEKVKTWNDEASYAVTAIELGRAELEALGLSVERSTYRVKWPVGVTLDAQGKRVINAAGKVWELIEFQTAPDAIVALHREVK